MKKIWPESKFSLLQLLPDFQNMPYVPHREIRLTHQRFVVQTLYPYFFIFLAIKYFQGKENKKFKINANETQTTFDENQARNLGRI